MGQEKVGDARWEPLGPFGVPIIKTKGQIRRSLQPFLLLHTACQSLSFLVCHIMSHVTYHALTVLVRAHDLLAMSTTSSNMQ